MSGVAIVIRTYNEAAILGRTLEQVARQEPAGAEVLVVDSGSTDGTREIARGFPQTRVVEIAQREFTFGKALNLGIAAAQPSAQHIVMLSADAVPRDDQWLSEILAPMREDGRIAGVYGKQVPRSEHLSNPVVRALAATAYPSFFGDRSFVTDSSPFFSNANSAITRESWEKHRFDESLAGAEDWDWAARQIADGRLIAYRATAAVSHSHAESFKSYYRRRCNDVRGARAVDPESYPPFGSLRLIGKIGFSMAQYLRQPLRRRSVAGLHWDSFRVQIISLLAQRATSRGAA